VNEELPSTSDRRAKAPRRELRLITYLAPGLPLGLFEVVAEYLGSALELQATLESETRVSAPSPGEPDPFSNDRADLGFLCAPGYFWLSERTPPAVELVPAAFQFDDPRTRGKPVYFSELIVRRDSRFERFADLRGGRWAYNDPCSLSGYFSMLEALMRIGEDERFFGSRFQPAVLDDVIRSVLDDRADCGAVDSNVLRRCMREDASLEQRLRVVETWGPFPIQPIVVRAGVDGHVRRELAAKLLCMHETERWRRALELHGVRRFVPIAESDLAHERRVFQRCFPQGS
jgi:phosphonate transport system substrate-binding protein